MHLLVVEGALAELVESGSAHIVGLRTASGDPFVARGWGARVGSDGTTIRAVLGSAEVAAAGYTLQELVGQPIAYTVTDVRTLTSAQLKGTVIHAEPASAADVEVKSAYCASYYDAVMAVDFISTALMVRMEPDELSVCTFAVRESFDQTPGPSAGRAHQVPS